MSHKIDTAYIENLTEDLIGSNRLYLIPRGCTTIMHRAMHIRTVLLSSKNFEKMGFAILGKIIANIEHTPVLRALNMTPLLSTMGWSNGIGILKDVAATLLTIVIIDRLHSIPENAIYKPSKFAEQIDLI